MAIEANTGSWARVSTISGILWGQGIAVRSIGMPAVGICCKVDEMRTTHSRCWVDKENHRQRLVSR